MAPASGKRFTALAALAVVVGMVGLSFAAVPLYRIFCKVTGFAGTTQVADLKNAASVKMGMRVITVSLLGNANSKLPWAFAPLQKKVTLRVGEQALVHYRATNNSSETITGVATFNVTPFKAGSYFSKVECFCFTEQTLKPGESADMPVTFYVEPGLARDHKLDDVTDIALSYTFFRAPKAGNGQDIARIGSETPRRNF